MRNSEQTKAGEQLVKVNAGMIRAEASRVDLILGKQEGGGGREMIV